MQNQIQIFENKEFGKVRVIQRDGRPWWVLRDVCIALGISNSRMVADRLDDDEKGILKSQPGLPLDIPNRGLSVISESGLYAVILRSDKPRARAFRKWVTSEVLPSIRQHGAFATPKALEQMLASSGFTAELIRNLAKTHAKNHVLMDYVDELEPKAKYCDTILQSRHAVPVSLIAKDYGYSAISFNKLLHALGVQYKIGKTWMLYQNYSGKGYTATKTYQIDTKTLAVHTNWTQKGRYFLYDLLKSHGILPEVERFMEAA